MPQRRAQAGSLEPPNTVDLRLKSEIVEMKEDMRMVKEELAALRATALDSQEKAELLALCGHTTSLTVASRTPAPPTNNVASRPPALPTNNGDRLYDETEIESLKKSVMEIRHFLDKADIPYFQKEVRLLWEKQSRDSRREMGVLAEKQAELFHTLDGRLQEVSLTIKQLQNPLGSPAHLATIQDKGIPRTTFESKSSREVFMSTTSEKTGVPQTQNESYIGYQPLHPEAAEDDAELDHSIFARPDREIDMKYRRDVCVDYDRATMSEHPEYRQIVKSARVPHDIKCDVWGATTLLIVRVFPDIATGDLKQENIMQLLLIISVLAMNLYFQFMLIFWIGSDVMLPNVKKVQDVYKTFRDVAYTQGSFDLQAFEALGPERGEICGLAISEPDFMMACLFLWVARCLDEFKLIFRRKRTIDQLPGLPRGVTANHMVRRLELNIGDAFREEKATLVCINRRTYIWIALLVFIPRLLIASILLVIGLAFLTASQSFSELIMNSLALGFVFNIDQLFFSCFMTERIVKEVTHTKIVVPRAGTSELDASRLKRSYYRAVLLFCASTAAVYLWFVMQPVLPGPTQRSALRGIQNLGSSKRL